MKANIDWQRGFNSRERWMRKRISKRWKKIWKQKHSEWKLDDIGILWDSDYTVEGDSF